MAVRLQINNISKYILILCILIQVSCKSIKPNNLRDFGGFRLYYDREVTEEEASLYKNADDVKIEVFGTVRLGSTNKVLNNCLIEFKGVDYDGVETTYKVRTNKDGQYRLVILPINEYSVTVYSVYERLIAFDIDFRGLYKEARLDFYLINLR